MLTNRRSFLRDTLKTVGTAVGIAAYCTDFPVAFSQREVSPRRYGSESSTSTLLFFDDWPLDRRDHVERHVGHPEQLPEGTFTDPHLNVSWGYPSVFRDEESHAWRCLYQGWDSKRKKLYPVTAESGDGINWRVPDLSRTTYLSDRTYPHQVLPVAEFSEWNPCFYDERAERSERIKGLVFHRTGSQPPRSYLWVSPDGLRWSRVEGATWQRDTPDPVTSAFWNPLRSRYVLTTRPSLNDRRIAVVETADWRSFSEPELALEADALDTPLAQTYAMPVFPYAEWFVGLLWIFHVSPEVTGESPLKFLGGKLDSQLTYSRNGWHFQRGLRDAFMPNSDPGRLGAGCLQPSSVVLSDDTIRIYSSATMHEHGFLLPGDGAIVLHTLRRDGFTYLESCGGAGVIGTRPLLWKRGSPLELNVLAPAGEVRVQITDSKGAVLSGYSFEECVPFTGDALRWSPVWKERQSVLSLPGRTLRLEIRLDNARLYAIRGTLRILTAAEVDYYEQGLHMSSAFQEKSS